MLMIFFQIGRGVCDWFIVRGYEMSWYISRGEKTSN